MSKLYEGFVDLSSNFNLHAPRPLDDRAVVKAYDDLSTLLAYEGMEVYVKQDQVSYRLIGDKWFALATKDYIDQLAGGVKNHIYNAYFDVNQYNFAGFSKSNTSPEGNKFWVADRWYLYAEKGTTNFEVRRTEEGLYIDNSENTGNRVILAQGFDRKLLKDLLDKNITVAYCLDIGGAGFKVYHETLKISTTELDKLNGTETSTGGTKEWLVKKVSHINDNGEEVDTGIRLRVYTGSALKNGKAQVNVQLFLHKQSLPTVVKWISLIPGDKPLEPIRLPYEVELEKCKKFYMPLPGIRIAPSFIGASQIDFTIPLGIQMHKSPMATYYNTGLRLSSDLTTLVTHFNSGALQAFTNASKITGITSISSNDLGGTSAALGLRLIFGTLSGSYPFTFTLADGKLGVSAEIT